MIPEVNIVDFFKFINKDFKLYPIEEESLKYLDIDFSFYEKIVFYSIVYNTKIKTVDFFDNDFKFNNGKSRMIVFDKVFNPEENPLVYFHEAKQKLDNDGFILWNHYKKDEFTTNTLNEIYTVSFNKWNFCNIMSTSLVLYYLKTY